MANVGCKSDYREIGDVAYSSFEFKEFRLCLRTEKMWRKYPLRESIDHPRVNKAAARPGRLKEVKRRRNNFLKQQPVVASYRILAFSAIQANYEVCMACFHQHLNNLSCTVCGILLHCNVCPKTIKRSFTKRTHY